MRRRTIARAKDPHPVLRSLAQCFARVHENVAGLLFQFLVVAQAVIEKIALPIHAMFYGNKLLPVLHRRFHSRLTWKGNDRVQVIWHKQAKAAVPDEFFVIEFHGCEHSIANTWAA